jgi:hypothetical protein
MAGGDLGAARTAYTESLQIARGLAAADPGNAQAARDVGVSLNDVGRVAMAGGDLGAARTAYTESLQIARGLAAADPGNAQAARDVSVSLWRLAELLERSDGFGSPAVRAAWADVVAQFDTMRDRGWIMPVDERFESQARLKAGGGGDDQDAQVPGAVTG